MRNHWFLPLIASILLLASVAARNQPTPAPTAIKIAVYFSPNGGATQAMVDAIDRATTSINGVIYSFTSEPIADALIRAGKRGVEVRIAADEDSSKTQYWQGHRLKRGGCEVRTDSKHAITHDKYLVIDERYVLTGSFNWSKGAESSNAENLLWLDSPSLAEIYMGDWSKHWGHADKLDAAK